MIIIIVTAIKAAASMVVLFSGIEDVGVGVSVDIDVVAVDVGVAVTVVVGCVLFGVAVGSVMVMFVAVGVGVGVERDVVGVGVAVAVTPVLNVHPGAMPQFSALVDSGAIVKNVRRKNRYSSGAFILVNQICLVYRVYFCFVFIFLFCLL